MKTIKSISVLIALCSILSSCIDLDIPPKNIIIEPQVFDNEPGITAYMAKLYNDMPMMDRGYSIARGYNAISVTGNISCTTGEGVGRDQESRAINGWWSYSQIRTINTFIETLPNYAHYHSPENIQQWLGEAYFIRAFIYTEMAKRYGGMPLVTRVLHYPEEDIESFKIHRSSEEDTWKQIESDYQYAIDNCAATSLKGRANKYVAAAYKASAMLHAASIANFNEVAHHDTERRIRLCGIPIEQAAYFYKSAYDAAKIFEGSPYSLYRGDWVAGDKQAQYVNFQNVLQKPDNVESIFVKEYRYPERVHSWDALYGPLQLKQDGLSGGVFPTLELVELYEGLNKDANGYLLTTNPDGTYIMYDNILDPFKEAEPRLRATVIFPCDTYKGEVIEIWRGVYKAAIPAGGLPSFTTRDQFETYVSINNKLAGKPLIISQSMVNNTIYTKTDGTQMYAAGASGSYNAESQATQTGFLLRKNLDTSLAKELVVQGRSESDWVDMRYAQVLLCRAEAAFELDLLGEVNSAGTPYLEDAVQCINDIRERAGCTGLFTTATITRQEIRDEFVRELAFENKHYWDLVRWRTYHIKHNMSRRYHSVDPIYAGTIDKWFFVVKYSQIAKAFTFNPLNYYLSIPNDEISSNPNLVQNPK